MLLADVQTFDNNQYGSGSGPIFLDDVACSGLETRLIFCPYISNHNCAHSEDVGIGCKTER